VELELELVNKHKDALLKQVRDISNMVNLYFIRQKEPKGLGHAINCARSFVGNEPFAVMLGDDIVDAKTPCLKQLMDCYEENGVSILGVQEVAKKNVDKYGIVDGVQISDRLYKVNNLVEKPQVDLAPSNIAILGRYIITPEIFDILDQTLPGIGGEIQLTDALKTLISRQDMYAYEFSGRRYDVGDKLGFLQATVEFALKRDELKVPFMEYLQTLKYNNNFSRLYEEIACSNENNNK